MPKKSAQDRLIEIVKNNPGLDTTGIGKIAGITYGTAQTYLTKLIKDNQLKHKASGKPWCFYYYTLDQFDRLNKFEMDKTQDTLDSYDTI